MCSTTSSTSSGAESGSGSGSNPGTTLEPTERKVRDIIAKLKGWFFFIWMHMKLPIERKKFVFFFLFSWSCQLRVHYTASITASGICFGWSNAKRCATFGWCEKNGLGNGSHHAGIDGNILLHPRLWYSTSIISKRKLVELDIIDCALFRVLVDFLVNIVWI